MPNPSKTGDDKFLRYSATHAFFSTSHAPLLRCHGTRRHCSPRLPVFINISDALFRIGSILTRSSSPKCELVHAFNSGLNQAHPSWPSTRTRHLQRVTAPSTRQTPESLGTDTALCAVFIAFRLLVRELQILIRHPHRMFTIKLVFHKKSKEATQVSAAWICSLTASVLAALNPPSLNFVHSPPC